MRLASRLFASLAMFGALACDGDASPEWLPELRIVPETAGCGDAVALTGRGFPPGAAIDVRRLEMGGAPVVATAEVNDVGRFALTLSRAALGPCFQGGVLSFVAGETGAAVNTPNPWPRADLWFAPPGRLTLEPRIVGCDEAALVQGDGFPPGSSVMMAAGARFSDSGIGMPGTTADGNGQIALEVTLSAVTGCYPHAGDVFAFVEGVAGRWSVEYAIVP